MEEEEEKAASNKIYNEQCEISREKMKNIYLITIFISRRQ